MSQKVCVLVSIIDTSNPRTLHLVPPGANYCIMCGVHKLRMGFHYTDQVEMWPVLASDPLVGMWSPSDEMVMPYTPCGGAYEGGGSDTKH